MISMVLQKWYKWFSNKSDFLNSLDSTIVSSTIRQSVLKWKFLPTYIKYVSSD